MTAPTRSTWTMTTTAAEQTLIELRRTAATTMRNATAMMPGLQERNPEVRVQLNLAIDALVAAEAAMSKAQHALRWSAK